MSAAIISRILRPFFNALDNLEPFGCLAARLWVAYIFFTAGFTKVQSWDSTLMLFEHEYSVPLLTPWLAAVLGTGLELILPVLLVIGLGGRVIIFVFFIYNVLAMAWYPYLWTVDGRLALEQHISWGLLLALLMFHGSGKLSIDHLLRKQHGHLL